MTEDQLIDTFTKNVFKNKVDMNKDDFVSILKEAMQKGIKSYSKQDFAKLPTSIKTNTTDFERQFELNKENVEDLNKLLFSNFKLNSFFDLEELGQAGIGILFIAVTMLLGNAIMFALNQVGVSGYYPVNGFISTGFLGIFCLGALAMFVFLTAILAIIFYGFCVIIGSTIQELSIFKFNNHINKE
jgi:hypothetical protein